MSHEASRAPRHHRQTGFSLPLALFIIVVLGLLATVLYRIVALNQLSVVQETLSARALLAAESGAHAGMMRLFPVAGGAASCSASISHTLIGPGFNQCQVLLRCTSLLVSGVPQYHLVSTATCSAGTLRASRVIEASAQDLQN